MAAQLKSARRPSIRRRRPKASRSAILRAALVEFAREGLAGARMDAIADAAGVNKALLYYYFSDKETLYGAILDRFFEKLTERIVAVCNRPGTAGDRFLSYVRAHFDAIAESPYHAPIFMSELMSATRGGSPHLERIFAKYMQPIGTRVLGLVEEGGRSGEFRAVDPNQFLPSAIGAIVHYFLTAPVRQKFMPRVDFSSPQAVDERRAAVLDFIAAALFADREAGIKLAARIAERQTLLQSEPVPQREIRDEQSLASPPPTPAPMRARPPVQGRNLAVGEPGNRWLPDFETAQKVLQEEAERRRKRGKPKRQTLRGEERKRI